MFLSKGHWLQFFYISCFFFQIDKYRGIESNKRESGTTHRFLDIIIMMLLSIFEVEVDSVYIADSYLCQAKSKHTAEFPTGIIPQWRISFCDKQTIALVTDRGNNSTAFLELCPQGKMRLLLVEFDSIQVHVHFIKEKLVGVSLVLDYIYSNWNRGAVWDEISWWV